MITSRFGLIEYDDEVAKFHHRNCASFVLFGRLPERSYGHLLAHGHIEAVSFTEFAVAISG